MSQHEDEDLALIGFGEAAAAFSAGWGVGRAPRTRAYDIKTDSADRAVREGKLRDYRASGVAGCATLAAALGGCKTVFSLVTADQAGVAARNAARTLEAGAVYLDCNSCSPERKRDSAGVIGDAGGRYVDVAVMAPVHPGLHRTPLAVSGPDAGIALATLERLGMNASVAGDRIGDASSIKMIRSIVMKGLEALVADCVLAGRKAGVNGAVLASLESTFPGFDWERRAGYMLERMLTHGARRAAEMKEVSRTLEELGMDAAMADATVRRQAQLGELGLVAADADYQVLADRIIAALDGDNE